MVATTRLRLILRHFTHSRTGDMYSKTQMPTPETALPGRSESLKVSAKHDVNGNRTVPPFPEGLQMAMFGRTGHTEVVRVVWEPEKTSFSKLLKVFWESHNPTQGMRQGNDVGTTYRSAIYTYTQEQLEQALASKDDYQKVLIEGGFGEITTEIAEASEFYYAEDYHQQYLSKNPHGYCGLSGTGVSCPIGLKK
ncbi:mitochondrial peptide methionine sulfoxide reductase-like isoform X4 [Coregonus clupeaformis]|uniref:mitochondrial peptide methionine sulfoxide reductase-like isoform X4 n=1 Tax=Coregonus clupeaformis TaxID=59861 RepID=UPI001E1C6015|nr:mitochondrial peptide methionine sulfoxide reductase-like isoform X4 [Coregonus clupeaformis]